MKKEPLTIEELKKMTGQPVWCPEEEAYGIVMCDKVGIWAGIPFLYGVWYGANGVGVTFSYNIIGRKLKCYRVISEKKVAKLSELEGYLKEAQIPYEIEKLYDGFQIGIPKIWEGERQISVIEHSSSYGSAFDLLELQYPGGEVRGFLKAETAFKLIQRIMEKWHEEETETEN